MQNNTLKFTSIFNWSLSADKPMNIFQGGSSSTKTFSLLQRHTVKCLTTPKHEIDVIMPELPMLKAGPVKDWERYIQPHFEGHIKQYNKSELAAYFNNGSVLRFRGCDSVMKAHGPRRDELYLVEANGMPWNIVAQLMKRTLERTFVCYNPSEEFWIHDQFLNASKPLRPYSFHRCTYKDATDIQTGLSVLSPETIAFLEAIKDKEMRKVYVYGLQGKLEGRVYDFKTIDEEPENYLSVCYGVDWGYSVDPTAVVKIINVDNHNFVVVPLLYQPGAGAVEVARVLFQNGYNKKQHVYCDHDKQLIFNSQLQGITALNAMKGEGSEHRHVLFCRKLELHYIPDKSKSEDLFKKEYTNYNFTKNRQGNQTNEVTQKNNHYMDAMRYGLYSHYWADKNLQ